MFYGWKVVAASFIVAVFSWGLGFYGPAVYVNALHAARGWSISAVSSAVTFHFLFSAGLVLFLADAYQRIGITAVTRAGIVAFALGIVGWSHAAEPWQLYPAAALTGLGWAATSAAAINTFVSPWFARRRAVALSHAYNGASIGGVLFTPLWVTLIGWFGFEAATIAVAVVAIGVLWPLARSPLARTPAEFGVAPDNQPLTVGIAPPAPAAPASQAALLADPRLLTLIFAFAIGIFAQMGLITHLVLRLAPVLGDFGAACALSLANAAAIVGRLAMATLIGESRRRSAAALNFLVQASGVACLLVGETAPVLLAGALLFGLGIGNLLSLPPLILQSEQAPADVGRALALLSAFNQSLFAFAPGVFGLLRDATGSYTLPFMIAGLLQLVSAAIVVMAPRSRR